jgi:hypothetical protein
MNNNQFKAEILTIADDVRSKINGKQFLLGTVKFKEGPLKDMTYFAQRTLGEKKAAIRVGQEINAIMSIVDNNPFFEISTGSSVTDKGQLLAALGL